MSIFNSIDCIEKGVHDNSSTVEYLKEVLKWGLYERGSLFIKVVYENEIEKSNIFISFNKRNYHNCNVTYEHMETYLPIKLCKLNTDPWMNMSSTYNNFGGFNINNYGVELTCQELEGQVDLRYFYVENDEKYKEYVLSRWMG